MKPITTLFDLSELEKRKSTNQKDFEEKNIELLIAFTEMVQKSFYRLNTEIFPLINVSSRNKNLAAVVINGFLMGELIKNFPYYCIGATKTRFRLRTPDGEWIYIKKLDCNKRPSNVYTINSDKIYNQLSDSKQDKAANIFLGYTASDDMTEVTGIYAINIDGEKEIWTSDITSLVSKSQTPTRIINTTKEITIKEGLVKVKGKKQA